MEESKKKEGNESPNIKVPFDPNTITINIVQQSIGQIIDLLTYEDILKPDYQRLPNLWKDKKKSRFIESLILGLPIPLFYFDEGEDKKWRVIDGLQRISTLEHFILGGRDKGKNISGNTKPLVLQELEFLTEYNGLTWDDLHRDIKKRILLSQITINLIGKGTQEQVKYNIFSRINQGSTSLEAQEIRTALFQGYRTVFIENLVSPNSVEGAAFIQATDNSIKKKRQEDLDFATRFLSFYLIDYKNYEPDLDTFLTKGTKLIPENLTEQKKIQYNFVESMNLAFNVFYKDAFRKRLGINDTRKPINKSIFEVMSTVFAKLSDDDRNLIKNNKEQFRNSFIELQREDNYFWNAITASTATRESVNNRHFYFNQMLTKFLNDTKIKNKKLQIA